MKHKFDLPSHPNPCCGYVTDAAATALSGSEEAAAPEVGDLTVCLNCGAVLVLIEPARNLMRHARRKELEILPREMKERLVIAQRYIHRRGWLPKEARRIIGN